MRQLDLSAFEAAVTSENLAVRGMRVFQAGQLIAYYQPEPEQRQNQYFRHQELHLHRLRLRCPGRVVLHG